MLEANQFVADVEIKDGRIRKQVVRFPEWYLIDDLPTREDYERCVGGSLNYLLQERWEIGQMIPEARVEVVPSRRMVSGWECWIDMQYIDGVLLSSLDNLSDEAEYWLAYFLERCRYMARMSRKELGIAYIPDLLNGTRDAKDRFCNFIVDSREDKLWFIDTFPLINLGRRDKKRYFRQLVKAAEAINSLEVLRASNDLIEVLG